MNTWAFVSGILVGWIAGVFMSYRKIRAQEKLRSNLIGKRLFEILEKAEVIKFTVTEDGEKELQLDQSGLDELLGNKDTKH